MSFVFSRAGHPVSAAGAGGGLPLYNQDEDGHPAEAVVRMKDTVRAAHGILIVTPEYNRSVPGVLKNALDHGSRPPGMSGPINRQASSASL